MPSMFSVMGNPLTHNNGVGPKPLELYLEAVSLPPRWDWMMAKRTLGLWPAAPKTAQVASYRSRDCEDGNDVRNYHSAKDGKVEMQHLPLSPRQLPSVELFSS